MARTWEAVDRLDQIVATLTEALHAELSPAGVQRQLSQLRAETAGEVAAAQTERARAQVSSVRADLAAERRRSGDLTAERDAARTDAQRAADRAAAALAEVDRLRAEQAEQARTETEQVRVEAARARAEAGRAAGGGGLGPNGGRAGGAGPAATLGTAEAR